MLSSGEGAPSPSSGMDAAPMLALPPGESEEVAAALARTMWMKAGIRREAGALASALQQIDSWEASRRVEPIRREGIETRNLILLGGLVCRAALAREESRGAHYRSDYPSKREEWLRHLDSKSPSPAEDLPRLP